SVLLGNLASGNTDTNLPAPTSVPQGGALSFGMRGDAVGQLQKKLLRLGFIIPADELEKQFFGNGTLQAVMIFQRQHINDGLRITGVVDDPTAKLIDTAIAALKPAPAKSGDNTAPDGVQTIVETFVVDGQVFSRFRPGVGGLRVQIVDKNVCND